MKNLADVIRWLETRQRETFDAGVFHQDMGIEYSATEKEAAEFDAPIEALRELRNLMCGEEGE